MPNFLGTKILKSEADDLLHTQEILKHNVIRQFLIDCIEAKRTDIERIKPGLTNIAKVFYNDQFNAYVFSKDDILRFFDGDPTDPNQPSPTADYLMILLGTHPVNKPPYGIGDATTIIAGCNDVSNGSKTKFRTLPLQYPATEHPQRDYKVDIDAKFAEEDVIELTLKSSENK